MRADRAVAGIVSDTHGMLRTSVLEALQGCELIIHAGDIDTPAVLESLQQIAPVVAVRGNMDRGAWAGILPGYDLTDFGGHTLCIIHDVERIELEPAADVIDAVISGHTHRPAIEQRQGVWYINPGSAGPRRPGKPVSLARLIIRDGTLRPEIVHLDE